MKRLFVKLLLLFVVITIAIPAYAFIDKYMTQSAIKTADAAVISNAGYFYGIVVDTDATNAVTVVMYDNTAASGTKFAPDWIVTTSATDRRQTMSFDPPLPVNNGIYIDVTTGGTVSYTVYYRLK